MNVPGSCRCGSNLELTCGVCGAAAWLRLSEVLRCPELREGRSAQCVKTVLTMSIKRTHNSSCGYRCSHCIAFVRAYFQSYKRFIRPILSVS